MTRLRNDLRRCACGVRLSALARKFDHVSEKGSVSTLNSSPSGRLLERPSRDGVGVVG